MATERPAPRRVEGVRPIDLVELVNRQGLFATVWVELSGTGAWGERADAATLTRVRRELERVGATPAAADTVGAALETLPDGASGVVVVADEQGENLLRDRLPEPPRDEVIRWAPVPSLSASIEHRQADIPALVVLVDRQGADIVISGPKVDEDARHLVVRGDDHPLTKSAPGGLSQPRHQTRAENTWERNAGTVAAQVADVAAETKPSLLVIGGDVRAVELLRDELPVDLAAIVRTVTSGRAANGSEERRDEDIDRLIRTAVAEETVDVIEAFGEGSGELLTANGPAETLDALAKSQVEVLLVHDDAADERSVWLGSGQGAVAADRDVLRAMGEDDPVEVRLVDAAIVTTLRTGGSVRIVPDVAALEGGIGAILRWPEAA